MEIKGGLAFFFFLSHISCSSTIICSLPCVSMSQQLPAIASTSRNVIKTRTPPVRRTLGHATNADHQFGVDDEDELKAINGNDDEEEEDEENCLICLGDIVNQSVLPKCLHSLFCFDCIIKWISIHRRCPLCSTAIEGYIIHSIQSDTDYIRHYIPSLNNASQEKDFNEGAVDPLRLQADLSQAEARRVRRQLQQRVTIDQTLSTRRSSSSSRMGSGVDATATEWGQDRVEERQRDAIANWDQRLYFRRRVYRERLYCQHIGTNSISRLSPPFSHSIISTSKSIESNLLNFIRRELLAYPLTIDVDFLSRYIIHVFKTFDCKSDEAINLMAEFLGKEGAQHFCHEVYSFGRFIGDGSVRLAGSRQRDKVKAFDEWARYNLPKEIDQQVIFTTASLQGKGATLNNTSFHTLPPMPIPAPTVRQEVIRGRANLLQKLEEEKKAVESGNGENPMDCSSIAKESNSQAREKALKAKLTLQRREAQLREQAVKVQAKRLKT